MRRAKRWFSPSGSPENFWLKYFSVHGFAICFCAGRWTQNQSGFCSSPPLLFYGWSAVEDSEESIRPYQVLCPKVVPKLIMQCLRFTEVCNSAFSNLSFRTCAQALNMELLTASATPDPLYMIMRRLLRSPRPAVYQFLAMQFSAASRGEERACSSGLTVLAKSPAWEPIRHKKHYNSTGTVTNLFLKWNIALEGVPLRWKKSWTSF